MSDEYLKNPRVKNTPDSPVRSAFAPELMETVRRFHASIPEYRVTPLHSLDHLAARLKIASLWVKDETCRFGLNAFKGLGVSYAMDRFLGNHSAKFSGSVPVWVTATDGNHGHALAWAARRLGHQAVVFGPETMPEARVRRMQSLGARVKILPGNYDEAVLHARREARRNGWNLLQDTAVRDREQIPLWIMQGYTTLLTETLEQLQGKLPTHVFVQCGVGSLAASVTAGLACRFAGQRPRVFVVEARAAACCFMSMEKNDGKIHSIRGALDTVMSGLACGRPSRLAWPVLENLAHGFFRCDDSTALLGQTVYQTPLKGDPAVQAGESGAVSLGLLMNLSAGKLPDLNSFLNRDSRILLLVTEGPARVRCDRRKIP